MHTTSVFTIAFLLLFHSVVHADDMPSGDPSKPSVVPGCKPTTAPMYASPWFINFVAPGCHTSYPRATRVSYTNKDSCCMEEQPPKDGMAVEKVLKIQTTVTAKWEAVCKTTINPATKKPVKNEIRVYFNTEHTYAPTTPKQDEKDPSKNECSNATVTPAPVVTKPTGDPVPNPGPKEDPMDPVDPIAMEDSIAMDESYGSVPTY